MKGKEFKFDRYTSYNPAVTEFPKHQDEIIAILAETYENRAADVQMYMKAAYQTAFGSLAAKRIFPLLQYVDFSVVFDGLSLGNVRIEEDNPDIIIDVDAGDGEVCLLYTSPSPRDRQKSRMPSSA